MKNYIIDLCDVQRQFSAVFPLKRIGYLYSLENRVHTFTDKLEFCIRCSSSAKIAIDIIDGKEHRTPFPHIIVKRPGVNHSYSFNQPRDAVYFQYSPEHESQMVAAKLITDPSIWEFTITPEISVKLQNIKTLLESSQKKYVADHLDLAALNIIELLIEQKNSIINKTDPHEEDIRKIASYFNLNFKEDINLEKLLSEFGFAKRSFFRYWKKYYKSTPAEYIKDLKIKYACSLLLETTIPVWQITEELNFKNVYYLCKIFKDKFGITPQEFRKNLGKLHEN